MDHFVKLAQVSARNCCSPRKPLMLRSPPPMLVVRPFHCSLRAPVGRGQPAKKPTEKAAPKARDASKKKSSSPTAAGSESAAGETSQERSGQPSISSMADLMANLSPDEQAEIEALSAADRAKFQGAMAALVDPENPEYKQDKEEAVRALDKQTEGMLKEFNDEFRDNNKLVRPRATDFFSMSEEDIEGIEQDPEVKQDDISSLGHGHLDHMREMRHYQRLAAWEMPMLQKLAKPFIPPTKDEPLRFRYTTYLGESHPSDKKVVVEFRPADLPLTSPELRKFKLLLGTRYHPITGLARMSCEMHETQAQNKRHLGDIVDALMSEARDTTDTFEDIPLDFRHHEARVRKKKVKQPVSFPKEWRMTVGRRMELEARRKEALQRDLEGVVVDGGKLLEDVANLPQQQEQRALFRDNAPARRASGPIGNMRSQRGATPLRL